MNLHQSAHGIFFSPARYCIRWLRPASSKTPSVEIGLGPGQQVDQRAALGDDEAAWPARRPSASLICACSTISRTSPLEPAARAEQPGQQRSNQARPRGLGDRPGHLAQSLAVRLEHRVGRCPASRSTRPSRSVIAQEHLAAGLPDRGRRRRRGSAARAAGRGPEAAAGPAPARRAGPARRSRGHPVRRSRCAVARRWRRCSAGPGRPRPAARSARVRRERRAPRAAPGSRAPAGRCPAGTVPRRRPRHGCPRERRPGSRPSLSAWIIGASGSAPAVGVPLDRDAVHQQHRHGPLEPVLAEVVGGGDRVDVGQAAQRETGSSARRRRGASCGWRRRGTGPREPGCAGGSARRRTTSAPGGRNRRGTRRAPACERTVAPRPHAKWFR